MPLSELQSKLGAKMGQTLFQFSRGIDDRPLTTYQQRQSVSADVNASIIIMMFFINTLTFQYSGECDLRVKKTKR